MSLLRIRNFSVSIENKEILRNLSMEVAPDTLTVVMGKNGTGKSTLAYALMGHPAYRVSGGEAVFDGESIVGLSADKIAKMGMFLGFQQPVEVPGVTVVKFLQTATRALNEGKLDYDLFQKELLRILEKLGIDQSFLYRYLNDGFSGGEKKRLEILQLLMLKPKLAILDEPDSGLDVDAMKVVADGINMARENGTAILLITHYKRLLNYLNPDRVIVLADGTLAKDGGMELADKIESDGYDFLTSRIS
ncbi:MAG: Fe-S cluster assembly ATPase SufC [Acidobacteria bacterium]|nr:Fe-S cluster assembly ATPase SufC [Acidobacteriota bacterium]